MRSLECVIRSRGCRLHRSAWGRDERPSGRRMKVELGHLRWGGRWRPAPGACSAGAAGQKGSSGVQSGRSPRGTSRRPAALIGGSNSLVRTPALGSAIFAPAKSPPCVTTPANWHCCAGLRPDRTVPGECCLRCADRCGCRSSGLLPSAPFPRAQSREPRAAAGQQHPLHWAPGASSLENLRVTRGTSQRPRSPGRSEVACPSPGAL